MSKKTKLSPEAFHVLPKSEKGFEMQIELPDGTETDETITVRGADSKKFRGAQATANRKNMDLVRKGKLKPDQLAVKQMENHVELLASLVVSWSFELPCTKPNVLDFLTKSPQIQEQIDSVAGDRRNFFEKPPVN
jgi:hypothetical protein